MAGKVRYLWGETRADYISFKPRTAPPPVKSGRIYYDTNKGFSFCDGSSYLLIRNILHN